MNTRKNSDEKQVQENSNPPSADGCNAPDCGDRLEDAKQEQYWREYLRQLRLRSCPSCGEEGLF